VGRGRLSVGRVRGAVLGGRHAVGRRRVGRELPAVALRGTTGQRDGLTTSGGRHATLRTARALGVTLRRVRRRVGRMRRDVAVGSRVGSPHAALVTHRPASRWPGTGRPRVEVGRVGLSSRVVHSLFFFV
jgi:hypothetical protein